ncbi:sugar ABC transporter permease [Domibacillus indicus]|uniref:carbohydrate ABC transporter permease n=1 Tax=Domibacillus TaxID=1433999 RepID=UPI00203CC9BC|nr:MULTISPECIES: sugar ABC transporter permease [Domibacillus]MCM3790300.1 sugar ABC transporter permease [Domibacillus indicus]WNS78062.1 sugar ABC transporter permease [Domibacillus sp. DTU_2020_1001157_1_SI_ALB_TIR_016]
MKTNPAVPYLFVTPGLLIVCLFIYYPVIDNLQSSFYSWNSFSPNREFLGIANYTRIFEDTVFQTALKNNLIHACISLIIQVFGGLVIAAVLEDTIFRKVAPLLRTVYFIPVLISITVIGLLFSFIYNPQIGLLNKFLEVIGLGELATGWLGNSDTAFYAVVAMGQWIGTGYIAMLYIVAMQKIPGELYEAAKMDGANKIQTFFNVTVPQVKEMTFVAVIFTLSQSMLTFADVYVLTQGGPGNSSQVLSTYLYDKAFVDNEMGYASTIANVIFAISIIFYITQSKILKTGKGD